MSDDRRNRDALYVLLPLTTRPDEFGRVELTRKLIEGSREYVKHWPGPVVVVVEPGEHKYRNLDVVRVHPSELPFGFQIVPFTYEVLPGAIRGARAVLASLEHRQILVSRVCRDSGVPCVYTAEYSLRTRRQIVRANTRNPLLRLRRSSWEAGTERAYRRALRLAAGVQCNGTPTYRAYRHINPRPLLFFDTRVDRTLLATDAALAKRTAAMLSGRPLRLAFSGRLVRMKGAHHLPLLAAALARLRVPFEMTLFGAGDLEADIASKVRELGLSAKVRLAGNKDFRTELVPAMTSAVDLFVCCHPQGDPSCTYLETMSCGTPIVGYKNEAWSGLVKHCGAGWVTPMNNPRAMAAKIAELHRHRPTLAEAATRARDFAAGHTFEKTFRLRIDHILECSGSRDAMPHVVPAGVQAPLHSPAA